MADDPQDDSTQEKQEDLLEQLGLHPAQLAVQQQLLSLARPQDDDQQADATPASVLPIQPRLKQIPLADAGTPVDNPPPKPMRPSTAAPSEDGDSLESSLTAPTGDSSIIPMKRPASDDLESSLMAPTSNGVKPMQRPNLFSDAENKISQKHHFWGGLLKGLDIGASTLAPGVMAMVPGSMLNQKLRTASDNNTRMMGSKLRQQAALTDQEEAKANSLRHPLPRPPKVNFDQGIPVSITDGQGNEYAIGAPNMPPELKTLGDSAVAAHNQRLKEQQDIADNKPDTAQQDKTQRRALETKLTNGTISDDEREDLTARQQEEKLQGVSAEAVAQVGRPPVPAQYPQGEKDAEYKKANAAWGKSVQQIKMQEAAAGAATRNQGFEDTPYNVINTKTRTLQVMTRGELAQANKKDGGTWVLATQGGLPSMAKEANAENIRQSMENVKDHTKVLDGGIIHRGIISAVLADPTSTALEFSQSPAAEKLNDDERDYVISVLNAREQIQGLRSLLQASGNSDARIRAIVKTLPGAATPDSKYANKQIDAAIADIDREMKGVPKVDKNARRSTEGDNNNNPPHPVKPQFKFVPLSQ
jgi:hypothetical protein